MLDVGHSLAHVLVILLVIVVVIFHAASGITINSLTDNLADNINNNRLKCNSQEKEYIEIQADSIYKMPKARGIKQIATAHMQREG